MHVIVGAGPVGSATAQLLADRGEQVRVITRSGRGPSHPNVELAAADATDAGRLAQLADGATALYNCANPQYHRWPLDWPPLAAAILHAAERSGAVLVSMSNLYGYGPVDRPMTEDLPLAARTVKGRVRADMWTDALAAHRAGRIRATEARASDYLGFGANSVIGETVLKSTVKGRPGMVLGATEEPHSFTAIGDVATTLVTLAGDERAWGHAWHVPSPPALTVRQLATRANELIGAPSPRLRRVPYPVLWSMGMVNPIMRELREVRYQFVRPFILDSSRTERTFGLKPTRMDETLAATAKAYRDV